MWFLILILSERLSDIDKKNHRDRKSVIWQKKKKRKRGKVGAEGSKSDRKKNKKEIVKILIKVPPKDKNSP